MGLAVRNKGITQVKVSELVDAPWNYRTHPDAQREALEATVEEIGWYGYPDVYEAEDGSLCICDNHPTIKPVELYANAYLNNSDVGDLVADLYAGSGTALIAAEQLGRRCYAMEIAPQYCDVAVQRWVNLTGKEAKLLK